MNEKKERNLLFVASTYFKANLNNIYIFPFLDVKARHLVQYLLNFPGSICVHYLFCSKSFILPLNFVFLQKELTLSFGVNYVFLRRRQVKVQSSKLRLIYNAQPNFKILSPMLDPKWFCKHNNEMQNMQQWRKMLIMLFWFWTYSYLLRSITDNYFLIFQNICNL